ncbi:MAG: SDR family oxidoreductase [Clostridia bacterium]|nr:SDR family oxidoreductase [Clostridia bacterium]
MNVLLTGATGKLGQNIANRLLPNNDLILLVRDIDKASKIYGNQVGVSIYECDLNYYDSICSSCKKLLSDFCKVDIIINNAALDIDQPMLDTIKEEFENIMKVNLFAPYYICKNILPNMIKNRFGKIINISSDLSMRTVKNAAEYSITKAGLDALTRSIAVEYGSFGITANSVNISGMKGYTTKVNESCTFSPNEEDYDDWKYPAERIPLNRRGTFSEYVDVIEFLCSNKSNYINGINMPVDGGMIVKF